MPIPRFIKWAGGKYELWDQYKDLIPSEMTGYREPFLGGGGLFLRLASDNLLPSFVQLSDANSYLIHLWQAIRDSPEELLSILEQHQKLDNKEYFKDQREICQPQTPNQIAQTNNQMSLFATAREDSHLSDVEKGALLKYLVSTAFNGLHRIGRRKGTTDIYRFNTAYGNFKKPAIHRPEVIWAVHGALQGVKIEHINFEQSCKKIRPGEFIFFDPPYEPLSDSSSFTAYTADGFTLEDQIRLRKTAEAAAKAGAFVAISNSNADSIRWVYDDPKFIIHEIDAARNINCQGDGRSKITELLITIDGRHA